MKIIVSIPELAINGNIFSLDSLLKNILYSLMNASISQITNYYRNGSILIEKE
jgi:hypothetical protein